MGKERILILGVTGMLGHTLFNKMNKNENFEVFGTTRNKNSLKDYFTLEELSKITWNEKLKIASDKIRIAWKISEPYVDRNNPPKKHENAEFEIELFWWVSGNKYYFTRFI